MTTLDPLRRFAPPRASAALRERVLAGARSAVVASEPLSRTDKIWFSPRWRLAWVAAIAACALVEAISVRATLSARGPARPVGAVIREADAAAAEVGYFGRGLIGDRVVSNDEAARGTLEDSL